MKNHKGDVFFPYGTMVNRCEKPPIWGDTVDGRNPAPVDMVNIPLFTGFYTSQVVVWDFWTINLYFFTYFARHLFCGSKVSRFQNKKNFAGLCQIQGTHFLALYFCRTKHVVLIVWIELNSSCWCNLSCWVGVLEAVLFCRCIGGVPYERTNRTQQRQDPRIKISLQVAGYGAKTRTAFGDDVLANALQLRLFFFDQFLLRILHHGKSPSKSTVWEICLIVVQAPWAKIKVRERFSGAPPLTKITRGIS